MPSYELAVIFKALERPQLTQAVKRTCQLILDKGCIIRSLENLGPRALPYRIHSLSNQQRFNKGHYFLVNFEGAPTVNVDLKSALIEDRDIIRPNILRNYGDETVKPCEYGPCYFGEITDEIHARLRKLEKMKQRNILPV